MFDPKMLTTAPRLSGAALRALVTAVRRTPARALVATILRKQLGVEAVRSLPDELRSPIPYDAYPLRARRDHDRPSQALGVPKRREWPRTHGALAAAFREGVTTPEEVANRAFAGAKRLANLSPSLGPLMIADEERALRAAREATERMKRGAPLGPLDGIPVAIKEEFAMEGLPHTDGTAWIPRTPATRDAPPVARLRAAGAVVLGHTPMTEYGMSPLGANPHRSMPRNPHDPGRLPGGSSTGSAVAVATGVSPIALGADGGGSIRLPSSLCGVFGIKPTFGRISQTLCGLGGGNTVVHAGPLAASPADIAAALGVVAGAEPEDASTAVGPEVPPSVYLDAIGRGVSGLRIGIDDREWAAAPDDIARAGRDALAALEREGAKLVPIHIKLAPHAAPIGYLTIGLEFFTNARDLRVHGHLDDVELSLQMLVTMFEEFRPDDYLDAQKLRATLRRDVAEILRDVDVIALPTTGCTAPPVNDKEAREGFIDSTALDKISRFAYIGNLTGIPAATAPVGLDKDGLPIGLQILGDSWDEACVLAVLAHLERTEAATVVRPRGGHVDLLA